MNRIRSRWPLAGALAGALCLALSSAPAAAHPHPEDEEAGDETRKEIRIEDGEEAQLRGGYLGVRVQDIDRELQRARDLPNAEGALINRVEPGSPADREGIRRGDVIVRAGGEDIQDSAALIREMRERKPGDRMQIVVLRDGSRKRFTVTLAKRPPDMLGSAPMPRRRWMEATPDMSELHERLDRVRANRENLQRQLDEIEKSLQRLEEEVRALRNEMRAREESRDRTD